MNNFLKDLGLNFSKDPETQKESAARKQIKDSEQKRDSLVDALNESVSKIEHENKNFFEAIGRIIYEKSEELKNSNLNSAEIETAINEIKKNEEELNELDKKREGIIERYNEEIEILKSAISSQTKVDPNFNNPEVQNNEAPDKNLIFCHECGAANPEGSIFCSKCGTKLVK